MQKSFHDKNAVGSTELSFIEHQKQLTKDNVFPLIQNKINF